MSNKEMVPEIRFEGFDGEWELKRLSEEVEYFSGLTYSPKDIRKRGTLVLRSSNVKNKEIVVEDTVYVNPEVVNSKNVNKGDIVMVVRNGSRSLIGKNAVIRTDMDNTVIGAFMTGIRSDTPEFISALLDTPLFKNEIDKNMGATINQITGGMLNKMSFYIPTKEEQIYIGKIIEQIDNNISKKNEELKSIKQFKQAMLQKMFPKEGETVPEIRFEGFEGEWGVTTLNDIMSITTGSLDANKATPHGKYKFFTTSSEPLSIDTYAFEGPSIVLAGNGVMGKSIYVPGNEKFNAYQRVYVLKDSTNSIAYRFIQYCINQYLPKAIKKKSSGSVISYITIDVLKDLQIYLPTNDEQKLIGEYFKQLDNNIQSKQAELKKLKQFKQAMLDKMFV